MADLVRFAAARGFRFVSPSRLAVITKAFKGGDPLEAKKMLRREQKTARMLMSNSLATMHKYLREWEWQISSNTTGVSN